VHLLVTGGAVTFVFLPAEPHSAFREDDGVDEIEARWRPSVGSRGMGRGPDELCLFKLAQGGIKVRLAFQPLAPEPLDIANAEPRLLAFGQQVKMLPGSLFGFRRAVFGEGRAGHGQGVFFQEGYRPADGTEVDRAGLHLAGRGLSEPSPP